MQLAQAYYQDQESDKAFYYFLESLKEAPSDQENPMSAEEETLFTEASDLYLKQTDLDPVKSAHTILERFGSVADQHPEFFHLNLIVSVAHANLGAYDLFFERFYRVYPSVSETFMVNKTCGVLYLRLSQRTIYADEKYLYQQKARHFLNLALEKNPKDSSLYKILIFLAKEEENDALVVACLQKMVETEVTISRGDIYLYVREAVAYGEMKLGQAIVDKACALYDYSRAITAAQEYLDKHISKSKGERG